MAITTQPQDKDVCIPDTRWNRYRLLKRHLGERSRPEVFPITGDSGQALKKIVDGGQAHRVYDPSGLAANQSALGGGLGAKTGLYAIDMTRREPKGYRVRKDGRAGTLDANYYKGMGNQERPGVLDGYRIRRLTPLECLRLQAFPDSFFDGVEVNGRPLSDSAKYKLCGNAVTVTVIEAVFKKIFEGEKE